jgi:hypothetical protein
MIFLLTALILQTFGINFKATRAFSAIWLADKVRLSGERHPLRGDNNIFFKKSAWLTE